MTKQLFVTALVAASLPAAAARAQELDFNAPAVEEKKDSVLPSSVGPITNIQLGGAVDWRVTKSHSSSRPFAFIHVNELVVSANVGEHISVSAEQLLLTSELGSVVGQDHGFVTVQLVQLPFLPDGMSLKLGRFRGKFGLDAQVDSPANIFPSQAVRSNATVTDIGLNLDYAHGDFEFIVEAFNGVDYIVKDGQKVPYQTKRLPLQARLVFQPTSALKVGLSEYMGESWDTQVSPSVIDAGLLGASLDQTRTIERQRVALDASLRTPYADFYGEAIYGRDKGRLSQPPNKEYTVAKGALARTDIPIYKFNNETRSKLSLQYDVWQDASFDGKVGFVSTAYSVMNDDGWTVRVGGSASDVAFKKHRPSYLKKAPMSFTTQLLVSF